MKKFLVFIPTLIVLMLMSCNPSSIHEQFINTDESGWSKDSAVTFNVEISDTLSTFRVLTVVRHTSQYPYQNFWMFLNSTSPEGYIAKDTIECFLADNKGHWLGNGLLSKYEMPVIYMDHIKFPKSGTYQFQVYQGMRNESISGISAIGLIIERQKDGEK